MEIRLGSGLPDAVLLDLDGTLVDSAPDLAASVNTVLERRGLDPHSLDAVKQMIGNGMRKLIERALRARNEVPTEDELNSRYAELLQIYEDNLTNLTTKMPGADALLDRLSEEGIKSAVVTNKPGLLARKMVEHFGWETKVGCVVGGDGNIARKPAPDMLHFACNVLDVSSTRAVMVGDSATDVRSAVAAKMPAIVVRGGYTSTSVEALGATMVVDSLSQVIDCLSTLPFNRSSV